MVPQIIDLPYIDVRQCLTIPFSRDNRVCHFFSYNVVENEAYFVFGCHLYNSITSKFQSFFKNVVLDSHKSSLL